MTYKELFSKYNIINSYDISDINTEPYNTIYYILHNEYRDVFQPNDRIVFYSRTSIKQTILIYIQKALYDINIDNSFIIIVSPTNIHNDLLYVCKNFSSNTNAIHNIVANDIPKNTNKSSNTSYITKPLPDTFCILPWVNLKLTNLGEFMPCCVYKDVIKDNNNNKFNVNNTTQIESVYNSADLNMLRQSFVNGEMPIKCSDCWNLEMSNAESQRIRSNTTFKTSIHKINFEAPNIDNILSVDIGLGISCNLKCRICSPFASSKILNEEVKHSTSIEIINNLKSTKFNSTYITRNKNFWNIFNSVIPTLTSIDFYGGEPLYIKSHLQFLKKIIALGYSNNINIHYNTNATTIPNNIIPIWNKFNKIDIAFSIDDIKDRFEYQRSGAKWNTVEQNINELLLLSRKKYSFSLFITVSVYNVLYLDEILDWHNAKTFDALHLNILTYPDFLNITNLSSTSKKSIIQKLSNSKHYSVVIDIINVLKNTLSNASLEHKLIKYTKKIDNRRNENIKSIQPEFSKLLNIK